jgi:hypothetical protein
MNWQCACVPHSAGTAVSHRRVDLSNECFCAVVLTCEKAPLAATRNRKVFSLQKAILPL